MRAFFSFSSILSLSIAPPRFHTLRFAFPVCVFCFNHANTQRTSTRECMLENLISDIPFMYYSNDEAAVFVRESNILSGLYNQTMDYTDNDISKETLITVELCTPHSHERILVFIRGTETKRERA